MADYGGSVLIEAPKNAWGIQTFKVVGADIKPGIPVTQTGQTSPEIVTCGTAADVFLGVVLCMPNHDPDTAYTAGDRVDVAMSGSGAAVWTFLKQNEGDVFPGHILNTDAGTGIFSIIGTGGIQECVGRVIEVSLTDAANDRPVKVVLCG